MREYKKSNDFYLEKLTKVYDDKRRAEKESDYYTGKIITIGNIFD